MYMYIIYIYIYIYVYIYIYSHSLANNSHSLGNTHKVFLQFGKYLLNYNYWLSCKVTKKQTFRTKMIPQIPSQVTKPPIFYKNGQNPTVKKYKKFVGLSKFSFRVY